ncbi:MAG: hypothetical protein AAF502_24310 [Bacteroidota bacterium]
MEKGFTSETSMIEEIIAPENDLEHSIISEKSWREGALWGKPRWGHPEGKIIYHVREVLDNIDRLKVDKKRRLDLRLIAITHDNFKHLEDQSRPRNWDLHHAVYARKFAEKFIIDTQVLDVIELHDEAFYAWRLSHPFQMPDQGYLKLEKLLSRLNGNLDLFYQFFKCDTSTGDKIQTPVTWFEEIVNGIDPVYL